MPCKVDTHYPRGMPRHRLTSQRLRRSSHITAWAEFAASKLVKSLGLACKGPFDGTRQIDLAPYGAHPDDHSGPCCEQRSVMQKAPEGAVA